MKKFVKVAALIIAAGMSAAFAGCAGCAGCNSNSKNNTLTNSNWFTGSSFKGVQPSFIEGHTQFSKESITYDVTYDGTNARNSSYSVEYDGGVFTTEFYAFEYNWNTNGIERYKVDKKEILYCYTTDLKVKVRYTLKRGDKAQSEWFDNHISAISYFRPADKSLQPVYSKQVLVSATPANLQTDFLENGAYRKINETYENFYNAECTEITSVKDGDFQNATLHKNLNKLKSTLFDNSSLYIALRSMRLSTSFSQPISLFSAAAGGISSYSVTGSDRALSEQERAAYTAILKDSELYVPAEKDDKGVNAIAANVNFTGGKLTGTTQTVWYAAVEKPDHNVPRATMLKISIPLSFALGTLNITLKQINTTIWNG